MFDALKSRLTKFDPLFLATVVIPTVIAVIYFGLIASDVYISEAKFVVRSPDKAPSSGLGVLLKGAGFSTAGDEIYAAQDFVLSRDALRLINKDNAFLNAYTKPSISFFDRFDPLGQRPKFEDLYKYYQYKVKVDYKTSSSISTLTVRAYDPVAAQRFSEQLLEVAEATVNRLNTRARQDLIRFAQAEVADAKEKSRAAALALSRYRNGARVVDPDKQAMVQLQMISKLQDELIASRTQLLQLRTYAPNNPQIPVLETQVRSLKAEIEAQSGKVVGGDKSLAGAAPDFQRLTLESQLADKNLAAAMASLQDAMNEAGRKQAYVERIVQPNLPDEPLEPRRWRGILSTLAIGLVAWGILGMLIAGIREHSD
jgi:capsular polysaccharide transport system permease protein